MGSEKGQPHPAKESRSTQTEAPIKEIKIQVQTCFEDMDAAASERERLMGSVALITGCSSGLGEALAQALHTARDKHGQRLFRVYATARREGTLRHLSDAGIATLALDVGSAASVAAAVAEVSAREGRIDVLINNAGISRFGPIAEQPLEEVVDVLDTNVLGVLRVTQAVVPGMAARRRGLIVNVGSVSAWVTSPFAGAYCASKAALNAMSAALRMELQPFGIRVTTVTAGSIASRFADNAGSGVDFARYERADSLYADRVDFIRARTVASQQGGAAMPASLVAQQIVRRVQAMTAPEGGAATAWFLAGGRALSLWFLGLLQMLLGRPIDGLLARKFGL